MILSDSNINKFSVAFTALILFMTISMAIVYDFHTSEIFRIIFLTPCGQLGLYDIPGVAFFRDFVLFFGYFLSIPIMFFGNFVNADLLSHFVRAPIVEEIQFRGFLLFLAPKISNKIYFILSLLSSIAFAICHPHHLIGLISAFVFAMISSYLIKETKNLLLSMIIHSLYNMLLFFSVAYFSIMDKM